MGFRGHAEGWLRFGGRAIALGVGFLIVGSRSADACFLEGRLGGMQGLQGESSLLNSCRIEEVRVEEGEAWNRHLVLEK